VTDQEPRQYDATCVEEPELIYVHQGAIYKSKYYSDGSLRYDPDYYSHPPSVYRWRLDEDGKLYTTYGSDGQQEVSVDLPEVARSIHSWIMDYLLLEKE
jgi:hypothetical protein